MVIYLDVPRFSTQPERVFLHSFNLFLIEEMATVISCQSLLQHQAARSYPSGYRHIAHEQFSMFV